MRNGGGKRYCECRRKGVGAPAAGSPKSSNAMQEPAALELVKLLQFCPQTRL